MAIRACCCPAKGWLRFRDILAAAGVMPGTMRPGAMTIAQREAEQRREAEKRSGSPSDRQRLGPERAGLPLPLLGLPPLFRFALGDGRGIRGRIVPRHHARRRQNVAKAATGLFAGQQQARIAIGKRQGVLAFLALGLADRARRHAIAPMPAPAQGKGQGARVSHSRPSP
ncbi:hypothetical protein MASR1M49_41270 [Pararhodobacter aggregans]